MKRRVENKSQLGMFYSKFKLFYNFFFHKKLYLQRYIGYLIKIYENGSYIDANTKYSITFVIVFGNKYAIRFLTVQLNFFATKQGIGSIFK